MQEKMLVTFHRINRCGYYTHGAKDPTFGSTDDLLDQLQEWSQGKLLGDTKLAEASNGGELPPVYLFGINKQNDCSLITTWNEVPAAKGGKIQSVAANAQVGNAQMVLNDVKKGTIPGYPTYFWAIPSKGVIATLRFGQLATGQTGFQEYCEHFLATQSKYAVQLPREDEDDEDTITVYGYREKSGQTPSTNVHPRFRTSLFFKPGMHAEIIKRADDIRNVHRRVDLELKVKEERASWQKALTWMNLGVPNAPPKVAKLRSSLSMTLTQKEVRAIIKEWDDSGGSEHDDFGFRFTNDSTIHWLAGSRAAGDFMIEVMRDGVTGQIDGQHLLTEVMNMKSTLLKLLT